VRDDEPRTRRASAPIALALLGLTMFVGCDRGDAKPDADAKPEQPPTEAEAAEQAVAEAVEQAGAEHLFDPDDESLTKRACEFLTADMVAQLFGVPAAELEQMKVMGCVYSWHEGEQLVEAQLMMLRVHETPERAATWFAHATATTSKAEAEAAMDQAKAEVQDRPELDTKVEKQTAGDLTELTKLGVPDEGYSYDDVPELGDEARISNVDGGIWVRLGNLTFQVQAYQGPEQPPTPFDPKNPQAMAAAAMKAQKQWIADTLDQRKAASLKLAPVVVRAISGG
jgi:hypothetical protein